MKKTFLLGCMSLCLFVQLSYGQTKKADTATTTGAILLTADSLASGNYKDILSSFFQLAFDNLTGSNKELKFTTNPYAIMLRHDSTLARDVPFQRLRPWRKLNFTVDAKLDSNNHFNGMSVGLTYALVDARDITVSRAFAMKVLSDPHDNEFPDLFQVATDSVRNRYGSNYDVRDSLVDQIGDQATVTTLTFDKLDVRIQTIIKNILDADKAGRFKYVKEALKANPKLSMGAEMNKDFNALVKQFQNKPLWTVGIADTTYKSGLFSKSLQLTTEYMQGTLDTSSSVNLEVDVKSALSFVDDTLHSGMNLNRQVFNFTPGLNLVVKGRKTDQPWLEFKLSGSYTNIWHGSLYKNENQITNTINGQLKLRIYNDIWLPVQISYDTKTHNVFGFLNVTTNFQALGGLFKSGNPISTKS